MGEKLAEFVEPHDLAANWMAHHLAELIEDAKGESATVEQRVLIVETILKLWMNRRYLPGKFPGYEFEGVFAGLDKLGDSRPWRFSGLLSDVDEPPDPESSQFPLVGTAADLERLAREAVITLLLIAYREARTSANDWIEAANLVEANLEGELSSVSSRVGRRLRELQTFSGDEPSDDEADEEIEGSPTGAEVEDNLSDYNHARRLREMAALLVRLASDLHPSTDVSNGEN